MEKSPLEHLEYTVEEALAQLKKNAKKKKKELKKKLKKKEESIKDKKLPDEKIIAFFASEEIPIAAQNPSGAPPEQIPPDNRNERQGNIALKVTQEESRYGTCGREHRYGMHDKTPDEHILVAEKAAQLKEVTSGGVPSPKEVIAELEYIQNTEPALASPKEQVVPPETRYGAPRISENQPAFECLDDAESKAISEHPGLALREYLRLGYAYYVWKWGQEHLVNNGNVRYILAVHMNEVFPNYPMGIDLSIYEQIVELLRDLSVKKMATADKLDMIRKRLLSISDKFGFDTHTAKQELVRIFDGLQKTFADARWMAKSEFCDRLRYVDTATICKHAAMTWRAQTKPNSDLLWVPQSNLGLEMLQVI